MAAGLADRATGDEQARPGEQPLLDRQLVAEIGAAGVADGGEAARQHGAEPLGRMRGGERGRDVAGGVEAEADMARHDVDMAVDQAGHQGTAAEIDDPSPRGIEAAVDGDDQAAVDQHVAATDQRARPRIEEAEIAQEKLRHAAGTAA